ncbi:MAG TPA: flagellar hook-basal body complex protein [Solirubrobacteraceae bacterium]|jgi:flagellar basal-body rod protein FlgG|nr:flagellar hook-basal body complex protein [Solirubrobacteraceae bacterium]
MDPGLYIAASGMLAEQVQQNALSNNLANASTPGYEPQNVSQQSFGSLLLANTATGQPVGTLNTGVTASTYVDQSAPTSLQQTGQPLDFGISGEGYFAVRTTNGVQYARDGQFQSNNKNELTDANGNLVLSQSGQPITVSAKGTVSASALGVFNVPNAAEQGNNLFTGRATGRATGTVEGGELNESGVDPVQTMTDMISSLRAYQAGQSAIQSIDQTMQENASQVGEIGG